QGAALLERLIRISLRQLAEQHTGGDFVFTVTGAATPDGGWQLRPAGTSLRYGAIAALGLMGLAEPGQRDVLGGLTVHDLLGRLAKSLDSMTNVGDAAIVCWRSEEHTSELQS